MIQYIEKPEFVSWDDIHEVLWKAHEENRANNVVMSFPSLPGYKIQEKIEGGNGKMFVALDDNKLIASAAFLVKQNKIWCVNKEYAYSCFAGVLPEYQGKGVYKYIYIEREKFVKEHGFKMMVFETHENNTRMISIQQKNGYKKVLYKKCKDGHHNVIMAKWFETCPYSNFYIHVRFLISKLKVFLKR